jgi:hypothetical protein
LKPPGPTAPDLAEAALAEKALQPIAGDGLGAFGGTERRGVQRPRRRRVRRREEGVEVRTEPADLPPTFADQGQQLRARLANFLRRTVGVMESVEELLHSRVVGHDAASTVASSLASRL